MEGFLSLEEAAQHLEFSVQDLSRQIEEGRVVAIVREGCPWLSLGEVTRIKKSLKEPGGTASSIVDDLAPPKGTLNTTFRSRTTLPISTPSLASTRESALDAPTPAERPTAPPVTTANVEPLVAVALKPPTSTPPTSTSTSPTSPSPGDAFAEERVKDLEGRCRGLEVRNKELEETLKRLKSGLQETEATLKRNRGARSNLENEIVGYQDQLAKAKSRNEALEREIQRISVELERNETEHNNEVRKMRSKDRGAEGRDVSSGSNPASGQLQVLLEQSLEKDRLLAQEYEQRGLLRSQLDDKQQKYFELKARYEKEKTEWSEILAREIQNQGLLRQQLEELNSRAAKGWNPFRREK